MWLTRSSRGRGGTDKKTLSELSGFTGYLIFVKCTVFAYLFIRKSRSHFIIRLLGNTLVPKIPF